MDEEIGADQAAVYANLWREVLSGVGPAISEIILGAILKEMKNIVGRLNLTYTFTAQVKPEER
jgi:hypothetical protein